MTKLLSTIAAVAIALIPALASAEPSEPITFRHDGEIYTYTVDYQGDAKILRGTRGSSRRPFVLRVGAKTVTGSVDGQAVAFSLRDVKRIRGIVTVDQLAQR